MDRHQPQAGRHPPVQQEDDVEDPGDEIGPESPGSAHMGIWFHDLDGYRWELNVPGRGD